MRIGIVGLGHVGQAMKKLFTDAVIFDKNKKIGKIQDINKCDVVFICVPTPSNKNGSCDTSIVESVIFQLNVKLIIIRSTVYVGFTSMMVEKTKKRIVFQPEYYGETIDHPLSNIKNQDWLSFGGRESDIDIAIDAYMTVRNSNIHINRGNAEDIEMAKYMENAFLATKVTFVNEMFDIANSLGVNFNIAREAWLSDWRIGRSHTFVFKDNRGYGGKCLPKDIASIKYQANKKGINNKLISAVIEKNNTYK